MAKNISVFGIYKTQTELELAIHRLKSEGFRHEDVSCLFPDNSGTKDLAPAKSTKAPEGATAGASTGAVLGGTLGWLVGAGTLLIPGVGPFIAAGPIVSALAGIGAGGALGGVVGALAGIGIPEYEAKRFEGMIEEGKFLLSVHCDDSEWKEKAISLLEQSGASDVAAASEGKATKKGTATDKPFSRHSTIPAQQGEALK